MKRRNKLAVAVAAALVLGALCVAATRCRPPVDRARVAEIEAIRSALEAPRPARPDEFRATVAIAACTGTRVGPRQYLTAAHCVVDPRSGQVKDWLAPPYPINLTNALDTEHPSPGDVKAQVVIVGMHVHPRYRGDVDRAFAEEDYRPDVALLVVDREIVGIPIAPIGAWRIDVSRPLLLVGTRPPVLEPADAAPPERRLKQVPARTVALDPLHAFDAGSLGDTFFLTVGPPADHRAYAISFGDSGGAAYELVGERAFVVGVHAVTFAVTTGHTRLDEASGVASWLEGLGAWVVRARSAGEASGG